MSDQIPAISDAVSDVRADAPLSDIVADFEPVIKETREGYKTTEFWGAVAGLAALNLNGVIMTLPDKWQAIGSAAIIGLYAISRGLAKKGIPAIEQQVPEA
jgi:hypothetical protein